MFKEEDKNGRGRVTDDEKQVSIKGDLREIKFRRYPG